MKAPHASMYVLVDMRGTILEKGRLSEGRCDGSLVPMFTFWKKRRDAETIRRRIRQSMSREAWLTWQFRVCRYDLVDEKKNSKVRV